MFACQFVSLLASLFVCLFCLLVCLFVCLFVCSFVCLFVALLLCVFSPRDPVEALVAVVLHVERLEYVCFRVLFVRVLVVLFVPFGIIIICSCCYYFIMFIYIIIYGLFIHVQYYYYLFSFVCLLIIIILRHLRFFKNLWPWSSYRKGRPLGGWRRSRAACCARRWSPCCFRSVVVFAFFLKSVCLFVCFRFYVFLFDFYFGFLICCCFWFVCLLALFVCLFAFFAFLANFGAFLPIFIFPGRRPPRGCGRTRGSPFFLSSSCLPFFTYSPVYLFPYFFLSFLISFLEKR